MSYRDEYIAKMKLQLDELNASMTLFEIKAHEASIDAQAKYQEGLKHMHLQSQLALAKLSELKVASDSTWDNLVAESEKVRAALVHAYDDFKSRL
jgi:hypothetical protein